MTLALTKDDHLVLSAASGTGETIHRIDEVDLIAVRAMDDLAIYFAALALGSVKHVAASSLVMP